jgi:hypothetical protein
MMRKAMAIDASWEDSARQYVEMYRYGFLVKQWYTKRQQLIADFTHELTPEQHEIFATFFMPGRQEYGDRCDWELRAALDRELEAAFSRRLSSACPDATDPTTALSA